MDARQPRRSRCPRDYTQHSRDFLSDLRVHAMAHGQVPGTEKLHAIQKSTLIHAFLTSINVSIYHPLTHFYTEMKSQNSTYSKLDTITL